MRIVENGTKHMLWRFSQFSIFNIKMRTNKFSMFLLLYMATTINNSSPVKNPDLVTFVREFIPIQVSEYTLENVNGRRKSWKCEIKCKYTTADEVAGFINRYLMKH